MQEDYGVCKSSHTVQYSSIVVTSFANNSYSTKTQHLQYATSIDRYFENLK